MTVVSDRIEAKRAAYLALAEWSTAGGPVRRNEVIRQAAAVGIPKSEIAVIVGLSRAHVYEIIGKKADDATDQA